MAVAKSIIFPINRKFLIRFFSRIKVSTEHSYNGDPCWEWTGWKNDSGYATVKVRRHPLPRQVFRVHRIMYEHFVGVIPDNLYCDHLCRVRHCVNPAHLEIVTHQENDRRGLGACGINARKTHCVRGHEFTPDNTRIIQTAKVKNGRQCLACQKFYSQRAKQLRGSLALAESSRC